MAGKDYGPKGCCGGTALMMLTALVTSVVAVLNVVI